LPLVEVTSPSGKQPRRLVIVGAGGHGRETLDVVEAINAHAVAQGVVVPYEFVGFVADDADAEVLARRGASLLGSIEWLASAEAEDASYTIAIGSSDVRARVAAAIDALQPLAELAGPLVHPLASVGNDVELGNGVILAAGARVTTNVRVGAHSHLNVNAVVSHDCRVGSFVTCSPGVLVNGTCTLEDGVFLGTGAIVTPGRRIGSGAVIGAGAVVLGDVPAGVTAVGVPARW
jgi:sugar O-acyltransferase (sialic acid O-acetyltransferase NeuD family)